MKKRGGGVELNKRRGKSVKSNSYSKYVLVLLVLIVSLVSLRYFIRGSVTGFAVLSTLNESDFNEGVYEFTFYNSTNGFVQLNSTYSSGNYTSKVFDVGSLAKWDNISWVQGGFYQRELPSNGSVEQGFGGANMSGNVLLLHLNELSGSLLDSSGFGNDGRIVGRGVSRGVSGVFGYGLGFNGNGFVRVNNSQSLNISGFVSVEAWFNASSNGNGWVYKRIVDLNPATPVDNLQVKIVLNSSNFDYSKAKSGGADLRFYQLDGAKLSYWVEKWNTSGDSIVWVKVVSEGTDKIVMYYGNPSAVSESDGSAVFEFFDDMESWIGWTQYGSGQVSQDSSRAYEGVYSAHKTSNNDPNGAYKTLPNPLGRDIVVRAWVNRNSNYTGGSLDRIGLIDNNGNGYGSGAYPQAAPTSTNKFLIDIRTNYAALINYFNGTAAGTDRWYEQELYILSNGTIIAKFYDVNGNLLGSGSILDSLYSTFTRFYIFGGHDYWVDLVRVRKYTYTQVIATVGGESVVGVSKPNSYGVGINNTTVLGSINNQTISAPAFPGWNHVVLTYDGSTQNLYVNGELRASQPLSGVITTNQEDLWIGDLFTGSIDEVVVYNRSLSAEEVRNHYERGVLGLDLFVRSCDDITCSGESWIDLNDSSPQNLSSNGVLDNQYFQYKYWFKTSDVNYTPKLYNVTISYTVLNNAPTIIMNNPPNNSYVNNSYALLNATVQDQDLNNLTVWFYGDNVLLNVFHNQSNGSVVTFNWTGLSEGLHNWTVIVSDGVVNSSAEHYFTVDLTNPLIQFVPITTVSGNHSQNFVSANVTAYDANLDTITISLYNSTDLVQANSSNSSPFFVNFTNLVDGEYYLNATVNDSAGNYNSTETRVINLDTNPPLISNVQNTSITAVSAKIIWNTDEVANSTLNYGVNTSLGTVITNSSYTTNHSIILTGLSSNTTYYYNVTSCDWLNHCTTSGVYNFTTLSEMVYSVNLTSSPNQTISTVSNATYVITVTNNGTLEDNYTLSVNNVDNVDTALLNQTVINNLSPGQSTNVTLTVGDSLPGNYTVKVIVVSNSNASVNDSVIVTTQVLAGPVITLASVKPRAVINGSNVSLFVSPVNANATWVSIVKPDSSQQNLTLTNNDTTIFTNTSLIGKYNLTFYANNSLGDYVSKADYFIAFQPTTFNVSVINSTGDGVNSSLALYYDNSLISSNSSQTGEYSQTIVNTVLDVEFIAYDGGLKVLIRGVNVSEDNNKIFGLDKLATPVQSHVVTYGVNNSYDFSNASVKVSYDGLNVHEDYLKLYKCDDWNFTGQSCKGVWVDVTSQAVQNKTGNFFEYLTTSFSGFSIEDSYTPPPSGNSGGGGGASSCDYNWDCTDWSGCVNGVQTRSCENIGTCPNSYNPPITSKECTSLMVNESDESLNKSEVLNVEKKSGESLFDIEVELRKAELTEGELLTIYLDLINVGSAEKVDVKVTYNILDLYGNLLFKESDTRAVEGRLSYKKVFDELFLEPGQYLIKVIIEYGSDQRAETEQQFVINEKGKVVIKGTPFNALEEFYFKTVLLAVIGVLGVLFSLIIVSERFIRPKISELFSTKNVRAVIKTKVNKRVKLIVKATPLTKTKDGYLSKLEDNTGIIYALYKKRLSGKLLVRGVVRMGENRNKFLEVKSYKKVKSRKTVLTRLRKLFNKKKRKKR